MPVVAKTAAWHEPTTRSLADLRQLPDNWDRCGAPRIEPAITTAAISLLARVMRDDTPAPSVVPTTRGGVQFEWHMRGIDLEIEFASPTAVQGSFEDQETGDSWEADLSLNVGPLTDAIAKLSTR